MAIRYKDAVTYGDGKLYVKANLTSADTKPTSGIATGSIAIETDTGKSYVFDEDSGIWTELKSSGGGITPTGTISITANGTGIDVAQYALADVNVSGGGGSGLTFLKTENLGAITVTATSPISLDKSITVSDVDDYDLLVVCIGTSPTNGHHLCTITLCYLATDGVKYADWDDATKKTCMVSSQLNFRISDNMVSSKTIGVYGIYPETYTFTASDGVFTLPIYGRYAAAGTTGTIDGNYTAYIYGAKLYNLF